MAALAKHGMSTLQTSAPADRTVPNSGGPISSSGSTTGTGRPIAVIAQTTAGPLVTSDISQTTYFPSLHAPELLH
jgi:hypothetical protein